jgi:hypothetical protein
LNKRGHLDDGVADLQHVISWVQLQVTQQVQLGGTTNLDLATSAIRGTTFVTFRMDDEPLKAWGVDDEDFLK